MQINNILLTTDFSENARKAYPRAASLASRFSARIHLTHFCGAEPFSTWGVPSDATYEAANRELLNEAATQDLFEDLEVTTHLQKGRWTPADLSDLQDREHIDIVVMATHGHTGIHHFVLGSFAERMVRASAAPVLVCHDTPRMPHFQPKVVLVPFDFTEASSAALPIVRFLGMHFGCSFRFMYVYEHLQAKSHAVVEAIREFLTEKPKLQVEEEFQRTVVGVLPELDVQLETCDGEAGVEILKRANQLHCDLIVLGTHGLLGSVAQYVTRKAPCDVLTSRVTSDMTEGY
jgi:nucleotide-binding universal stress UspA family protein